MFEIEAVTDIQAPQEIVWETLTTGEAYPQWSSMLHYLGGRFAVGEKLNLRLTLAGGTDYRFSPTVVDFEPLVRFAWLAVTGTRGIFDGEHLFELTPLGPQQTRLVNRERYSGLLSPIIKRLPMMKAAPEGFAAMNAEIKSRSEWVWKTRNLIAID